MGLKSITDGEFRRVSWNYDFLERLEGVESYVGERKIKFNAQGPQPRSVLLRVAGKVGGYAPHPMIEYFRFLKTQTRQTPKVTIPSPSAAFPLRPRCGAGIHLSGDGGFLSRPRPVLRQGGAGLRRCRLPLSSARRGQPRLSVRSVIARARHRPRGRSGDAAGHLCRYDQCRDCRYHGRYDHHHASVPRQFPLEIRRRGRL